ncbi:MAG: protein kinase domain-containing protein [Myxococcota bacterium]
MEWVGLAALILVASAYGWRQRPELRRGRAAAEIRDEIAQGRYHRAVPYLLEAGRIAEAARLEAFRGNTDRAVSLYEQADDVRGAASVYLTRGEFEMAAMVLRDAGLTVDAAEAFVAGGHLDKAVPLLIAEARWERAKEVAETATDPALLALVLAGTGDSAGAARLLGEQAEDRGSLQEAAEHWLKAGDPRRAAKLLGRDGRHQEAAKLYASLGDHAAEASALLEAGNFQAAGEAFIHAAQFRAAGRAFLRSGDIPKATTALSKAHAWLEVARVHHNQGDEAACLDALMKIARDHVSYEEAQTHIADIHRAAGRAQAAYTTYQALVSHRVSEDRVEPVVRRWVVAMAEILFKNGNTDEGLACLESLEEQGLMTPQLRERIDALGQPTASQADLHAVATFELPEHERYEFVDRLGEGGNGVIFRARDKMLAREIAIKMIGRTKLPSDMARTFFLREARMAAQLNHPNIVTIYDLGQIEDRMYIAMELIDGESLAETLETPGSTLDWERAEPIVDQLCAALDYAHERDVVHQDVKLENVMVTGDGAVKLMDFGLARAYQRGQEATNVVMGTPLYMSPEQIRGQDVDHRTDIYALGVTLYRIFTGTWPYRKGNIMDAHRRSPVPDPRVDAPDLSEDFATIIAATMAKLPSDRPDCAAEVSKALKIAFS